MDEAKEKLRALINWNISLTTTPNINERYPLQPYLPNFPKNRPTEPHGWSIEYKK